jgi:hypothetical protein
MPALLSVSLTINAVEYAPYVRLGSLSVTESLRDRAGTLTGLQILLPYTGGSPAVAVPRAGREVVLTIDGSIEFGGIVQRVRETPAGTSSYLYEVDCADYVRLFDRFLVQGVTLPAGDAGTYGLAGDMVRQIVTTWANKSGDTGQAPVQWSTTYVEDGPSIPQIVFDFETPSQAIDRIAKVCSYIWYVDSQKRVIFREPTSPSASATAPVATVTWETDTTVFDLMVEETGDQIVNLAYIKDAKTVQTDESGNVMPYPQNLGTANGYETFFKLGYEPAGYDGTTVTVTPTSGPATTYTVANGGLLRENLDGHPGDDKTEDKALLCLPNWGVRFQQPPADGSRVTAEYPYLDIGPAVWQVPDGESIAEVRTRESASLTNGIYEEVFSASDLANVSADAIRARAELYLRQRRHRWTGSAGVYGTGWHAGQRFTLTSSARFGGAFASGRTMWVTAVTKRFPTPSHWQNDIEISSDVLGEL